MAQPDAGDVHVADADVVDRLNEALEGRYRIERELGAGGMATVYLARDLRHERNVAPASVSGDAGADVPRRVILVQNFFEELRRLTASESGR